MLDRLNVSTVTGVITQVVTFLMQLRMAGVEIMGSFNKRSGAVLLVREVVSIG